MVDRIKSTGVASIALAGLAVIMTHTTNGELFSAIIATEGIENDAAVENATSVK